MTTLLRKYQGVVTAIVMCLAVGVGWAGETTSMTVQAAYPDFASGVLLYAQPKALPDGVLLRADGVEIKLTQIEETIARQPLQIQEILRKELFYVLEQEAAGKLLVLAARKALNGQEPNPDEMTDEQLINTLFDRMTRDIVATEDEQRVFYQENPHFFHGAPFDRVQPQIAQFLTQQNKQQAVEDYIRKLGQTMTIEVADAWTKQQAEAAKDNPLDKARQSGTPTVVMFYSASPCCPDTMEPIMAAMGRQFGDKLNVLTLNPGVEPILAARYNVRGNPCLIFYGADGKETYRQQGAISRDEMTARLAGLGIR